jgi:hypothetical protein
MHRTIPALLALWMLALPSAAQDWRALGTARVFTNDALGDRADRWRTGSYTLGRVRGRGAWEGALPETPGAVLEWRLRSEIVAPAVIDAPRLGDRRYAGLLSLGLHTHFRSGAAEVRAGLDLVATGPQTQLDHLQGAVHDLLSVPKPDTTNQIGNALYPTLSVEIGRDLALGAAVLRAFAEVQAGVESFGRIGLDVVVGTHGRGGLLLRDPVTGHRVTAVRGEQTAGFSLVLGADTAVVADSRLLPAGGAAVLERNRHRLRLGGHWMGGTAEVFYGVAWLSREFAGQDEGQVVGALNARILF